MFIKTLCSCCGWNLRKTWSGMWISTEQHHSTLSPNHCALARWDLGSFLLAVCTVAMTTWQISFKDSVKNTRHAPQLLKPTAWKLWQHPQACTTKVWKQLFFKFEYICTCGVKNLVRAYTTVRQVQRCKRTSGSVMLDVRHSQQTVISRAVSEHKETAMVAKKVKYLTYWE